MTEKTFRLEDFFAGRTRCWGIFEDRFGKVRRSFVIDLDGVWSGRELTLTEDFRYDDGERGRRVWTITPDGPDGYVGRATDVVGEARGTVVGNTFTWRYTMILPVGSGTWRVRFVDSLMLQPDGVLLNRAFMSRFGVTLGSVSAVFRRWEDRAERAAA